jgi:hypothetical protein
VPCMLQSHSCRCWEHVRWGGRSSRHASSAAGQLAAWGAAVLARERLGRAEQGDNYPGRVPLQSGPAEKARLAGRAGRVGRGGAGGRVRESDTCDRL